MDTEVAAERTVAAVAAMAAEDTVVKEATAAVVKVASVEAAVDTEEVAAAEEAVVTALNDQFSVCFYFLLFGPGAIWGWDHVSCRVDLGGWLWT